MSHQSDLIAKDIQAYLAQHEKKELLRFLTCGSVDDGKSTLIGRLLYDSKMIYEDQLAKLEQESAVHGTTGGGFDPSMLADGLEEEKEQGITIDVAYLYFSTSRRKFIIADTPGHVQYTRNMATGASTANLAIILVDARKGILEQTKRHSFLTNLLGIRHILVAINKMDLVDFSEQTYNQIKSDYKDFSGRLETPDLHFMPISALHGDNVVDRSENMTWYGGPTLMNFLNDSIEIGSDRNLRDFRFPVQSVLRPDLNFRGFTGTIASGIVRVGDEVISLPSRKTSRVKEIVTYDGNLKEAFAPMAVTLTLEDEIDTSRGDMIVRTGNVPKLDSKFDAMIVWMSEQPMLVGTQYVFKHTSKMVSGNISTLRYRIDVNTMKSETAPTLELNQIGRVNISLNQSIAYDQYRKNKTTGAFIVIDRITNVTVGAGMILDRRTSADRADAWDVEPQSENLSAEISNVSPAEKQARFGQQPATILITGLPGAGKTTTAYGVERALFDRGRSSAVLDGQNLRVGLARDLGFSKEDRSENLRRATEVAKLVNKAGMICVMALVAPNEETRQRAAQAIGTENFILVHLDAPPEICAERNLSAHQEGAIDEATPNYQPPADADLVLNTIEQTPSECVASVMDLPESRSTLR